MQIILIQILKLFEHNRSVEEKPSPSGVIIIIFLLHLTTQ
jgi:hypothetical protein